MVLRIGNAGGSERIVIGLDFRDPALAAARWVVQQFGDDSEFVLVHLVAEPEVRSFHRSPSVQRPERLLRALDRAEAGLRGFATTLPAARVRCIARGGSASEELGRIAREEGATFIALGRSEERSGAWTRIGRSTERLLRTTPVPVLMIPGGAPPAPRTIVAAIDDAAIGADVAAAAARMARRFGARLVAIHVVDEEAPDLPKPPASPSHRAPSSGDAIPAAARGWLWSRLRQAHADVASTTTLVVSGSPGRAIITCAEREGADLIVVGRHGAHSGGHHGTGGVTRFVLRAANCPVLTVPEMAPVPPQPRRIVRRDSVPMPWEHVAALGDDQSPPAA